MAFKLDYTNAQAMQLSSDAFWYLYQEEEMIDDANMDEAEEIISMFPNGFIIQDDWQIVEDEEDLVACTIIPYIIDNIDWDGECRQKNDPYILRYKKINGEKVYIQWADERSGKVLREEEARVKYFNNKPWCVLPNKKGGKQDTLLPLFNRVR